jgi:2-oxoglutarate dehydrogenase E2 component (dihydrolipoamide succinyltransferase)
VSRLAPSFDLHDIIAATSVQPIQTDGFSVSFDYVIVTFDRPWWDDVFVANPSWTTPGFTIGQLSSGSASSPAGLFITLLTTGMIVIRRLVITASSWQDSDRSAIASATSLGPFCMSGSEFTDQELRRPGIQVVAWICQIPPVMPPSSQS